MHHRPLVHATTHKVYKNGNDGNHTKHTTWSQRLSTAATNDMLVLASGSESQRSEMTVVLRRVFLSLSPEGFFLWSLSSLSSGSSCMIPRGELGSVTGWRLDFEELEGQYEPPV
jgi:hypothetical protein